jgi:large subunit ribosomal protein L32e
VNYGRKNAKRVKKSWRRPRGIDSKRRKKISTFGAEPNIGHGNPRAIRGLHPTGKAEVRVFNVENLAAVPKASVVRIARTVGKKKRSQIYEKAKELGLKVLN